MAPCSIVGILIGEKYSPNPKRRSTKRKELSSGVISKHLERPGPKVPELFWKDQKMIDLAVRIGNLELKNPVLTASGTFGYGEEFKDFFDINQLGGIVVKGTTLDKRVGNPYPRMAETPCGMLNAVGLQNEGINYFIATILPRIREYQTNIILNVAGSTIEEYQTIIDRIADIEAVSAIELNISCPNVKEGGLAFGSTAEAAGKVVREVRNLSQKTLIVKLTPNVTDITKIALACEAEGADAISLVNTFLGMAIDVKTRRPMLSTVTGGLSGPCIKPIALRMVWQVANAIKIPVIGMGGIASYQDAIEFILAGAQAIQVGTANFLNPSIAFEIIKGIEDYLAQNNFSSVNELVGSMIT